MSWCSFNLHKKTGLEFGATAGKLCFSLSRADKSYHTRPRDRWMTQLLPHKRRSLTETETQSCWAPAKNQRSFQRFLSPLTFYRLHNRQHQQKCHRPQKYPRRASTHCTELFKGYPAVSILVCVYNGLVHNLLELRVLQVVAHHHLQYLEELAVGDVAVLIHVVNPEGNCGSACGVKRENEVSYMQTLKEISRID